MPVCPSCQSSRTYILDKGIKKVIRFFLGNNRFACRECHATWREKAPSSRLRLKHKRHHAS
jgi:transposase-like protein